MGAVIKTMGQVLARATAVALVFALAMLHPLHAQAAPRVMPGGEIFDAEYYAAQYPDVVAVFGTDEALLYQHYVLCGRAEGRLPYAPDADLSALQTPVQVSFAGRVFTSTDREADLSGINLRQQDVAGFLAQMPYLTRLTLIGCGLDNAGYAALQDAYPQVRMIWEIKLPQWTLRTDAVAFSTFRASPADARITDSDAYYFRYCTDLVALDIGHNYVRDLSFLQYMPKLKVLIVADNAGLTDLSPIRYATQLQYLEIFVNSVYDLSFLDATKEMVDLNISFTRAAGIEHLMDLPKLERLWLVHTGISAADVQTLRQRYPGVTIVSTGSTSIGSGWREGSHYAAMRAILKQNVVNEVYY